MAGKTADPVKVDRFGNPIVITPVPRADGSTGVDLALPTDIRQLPIGPGTYDAVTGKELNTPVRVPAALDAERAMNEGDLAERPAPADRPVQEIPPPVQAVTADRPDEIPKRKQTDGAQ